MMWVQTRMIGHFLITMMLKCTENIVPSTNQSARVRGKIHRRFPSPPIVSTGNHFISHRETLQRHKDARIAIVGLLFVQSDFCIWYVRTAILRTSVVVFKASSCILRHHSHSVFFTIWIIRSLPTVMTQKSLSWQKTASSSRDAFHRGISFSALLFSYFPLPVLTLCTFLFLSFSEAEINMARLLLPA